MKLATPVPITEIATFIGAEIIGNKDLKVVHLSEIHKVQKGSLLFVDKEKYFSRAIYSHASAIIVNKRIECPPGKALLLVDSPFDAYNELCLHYLPFIPLSASISPTAKIGKNTVIEPGVTIGHHVTIGNDCIIRANTVILDHSKVGNRVVIHPNTTLGSSAFYFHQKEDKSYERWHSIGRVIIEDDVEIGAGCTIDRGVSGDTIIGQGSKLDNLVHIGHGVEVGKHCLLAAQVGIAGKTIIQDYVTIYGQAGIAKSIVVGEGAVILPQTGVSKSIPGDKRRYIGTPASEAKTRFREFAATRRLPELLRKLDLLENILKERGINLSDPDYVVNGHGDPSVWGKAGKEGEDL
ncbi:MAG: UDP-3-O-(3-hydroxymyristoyl)glucosamine N-acyltransferase [Saprospiraceae bacterium]|nr:UDP-3-O-(3-hydroxymyristoyl)glucosamine N-acyltransferase [Saprospiraceae bacterium]